MVVEMQREMCQHIRIRQQTQTYCEMMLKYDVEYSAKGLAVPRSGAAEGAMASMDLCLNV